MTDLPFAMYCVNTLAGLNAVMRLALMGSFLTSAEEEEDGPAVEEKDGCAAALEDDPEAIEVDMLAKTVGTKPDRG